MFLYFILWAAVSAAYSALLSSSYFERINDDDDDDDDDEIIFATSWTCIHVCLSVILTLNMGTGITELARREFKISFSLK